MEIKIQSLVSREQLRTDADNVLGVVERTGKAVVLQDNKPAYIIIKCDEKSIAEFDNIEIELNKPSSIPLKLHEAMAVVLKEQPERQMHAADLADEIYNRNLYKKKDGTKAMATQIRARSGNYNKLFSALSGNIIKLKS